MLRCSPSGGIVRLERNGKTARIMIYKKYIIDI